MHDTLTPKQARFVEEYLIDLNGTQAAIRAGYSARTANEQASALLAKLSIGEAVREAQAKRSERTEITQDRVLTELGRIGFANMLDYMRADPGGDPYLDFSKLTREQAAALVEVTVEDYVEGRGDDKRDVKRVKFKLADKRAALVDLGRHLGMFVDRHELSGRGGGPIETNELSGAEKAERARRILKEVFDGATYGAKSNGAANPPTERT